MASEKIIKRRLLSGHSPEKRKVAREPLNNSGSPLAFRALHSLDVALQEGWLPFKKSQRRERIALKAPKGAL